MGYISTNATSVYIGADHTGFYPNGGPGRPSVRLTSNNNYTHGLFILDLSHMPFGCGTWPAFWTFGPSWPNNGEIGTSFHAFVEWYIADFEYRYHRGCQFKYSECDDTPYDAELHNSRHWNARNLAREQLCLLSRRRLWLRNHSEYHFELWSWLQRQRRR